MQPLFAPLRQKAPQPGAFLLSWLPRTGRSAILFAFALLLPFGTLARNETSAFVRHVLDGDSVILADQRQVRLIGINAPEFGKDGRPDEPLAVAARDRLRTLVEGKAVKLQLETEERDHYGRWLAHVLLADSTNVEEVLLKEGLVAAIAVPPNVAQVQRHQAAESLARKTRRGLWAEAYFQPITAESLTADHTGFHFVRGRVTHVGRSKKFVYLDIGAHFALRIAHADWRQYFQGRPDDWRGVTLVARGWISAQNGRLHMGIGHPAMLERMPNL